MLTYKNVFLGENQLLLPADVGVRNIATALPFNIMCPWLSRSKLLKVVLVNLLICMVVFYTVYYVVLSVCFAVFSSCDIIGNNFLHLWFAVCPDCGRMGLGLCCNSYYYSYHHNFSWKEKGKNSLLQMRLAITFCQHLVTCSLFSCCLAEHCYSCLGNIL
ncbi:transmembrane protein 244 isoform X2 [Falco biarmicus]|uniref:transmembrane protein 244 isoform X2 n=1 Tax=Falco peregrinus TaxID=8954 RepID=UPI000FFC4953|nr:transmembrane protein 244 isoform X2 [Falco peregrinus]XP_037248794.1 transmembrane protein 244 isoform X2 [Falco rusticolus]XP_056200614.1 transmembrane protein 244 isoform X2 [Falco biarmicus]